MTARIDAEYKREGRGGEWDAAYEVKKTSTGEKQSDVYVLVSI